jgi:hypothetical protein
MKNGVIDILLRMSLCICSSRNVLCPEVQNNMSFFEVMMKGHEEKPENVLRGLFKVYTS